MPAIMSPKAISIVHNTSMNGRNFQERMKRTGKDKRKSSKEKKEKNSGSRSESKRVDILIQTNVQIKVAPENDKKRGIGADMKNLQWRLRKNKKRDKRDSEKNREKSNKKNKELGREKEKIKDKNKNKNRSKWKN